MDKIISEPMTESTGVVIIGAGISGLGAAAELEQSNFKDYLLIEGFWQIITRYKLRFFILSLTLV